MGFLIDTPKFSRIEEIPNYEFFRGHGRDEMINFLINFLGITDVRIQGADINVVRRWLEVEELSPVNKVPHCGDNELCLISQIIHKGKLIAYYPYVLVGNNVAKLAISKGFMTRITEAISEQITACYLRDFKGGDWLFGDTFAQRLIANCITRNEYKDINFAHLIEKMEHLSVSTFEGVPFSTGVIVSRNLRHYKSSKLKYLDVRHIDNFSKRDWFMADGKNSFFLLNTVTEVRGIIGVKKECGASFVEDYFNNYYLHNILNEADFIIRTVGPNEISVSDFYGKEFVKVENVWRYRDKRRFVELLENTLAISNEVCNSIIYFSVKCSRNHISSIIWIPDNLKTIKEYTTQNRIRIWNTKLNITNEAHEAIIDKVLASDGAIVIEKNGDIMYESVFAEVGYVISSQGTLSGTGETAAKSLAQNGVAIKISQDGTIKVFYGKEKYIY